MFGRKVRESRIERCCCFVKFYSGEEMAKRILIVDDEPSIVSLLNECLKRSGFDVQTALGGVEGLTMLENGHLME